MTDVIQDRYPDALAHCYGCGRNNPDGLHVRSRWEGDVCVATLTPESKYMAAPGYVYGGLIASLIDCHGIGTAVSAVSRHRGIADDEPVLRCVTASLQVDYRKPTPQGVELRAEATVEEVGDRKAIVSMTVSADGTVVATGRVVGVLMPESMATPPPSSGR